MNRFIAHDKFGRSDLTFKDLKNEIDNSKAAYKLIMGDACLSGAFDKDESGILNRWNEEWN